MIEIKNIRQIGTPTEEDKIYIEDGAYQRLHQDEFAEKRVFVFMGRTECQNRYYTTFIEHVIPVRDLDFMQNIPVWNARAWSEVFREIKCSYEDSIIVGWALDIKGIEPKMTTELENMHREQFGGAHQLLFLMDSLEEDECFFLRKGNQLRRKNGFYIYYDPQKQIEKKQQKETPEIYLELPKMKRLPAVLQLEAKSNEDVESDHMPARARYRQLLHQNQSMDSTKKNSSFAVVVVAVLLLCIFGMAIYQDKFNLSGLEEMVEAMSNQTSTADTEEIVPIEQIPGGEVMNP